ncbi:hypothetical protein NBE98_17560 [Clostridium swellfunianum]|uniref:hypothetical protein n=1 Tax=Clostridium swellfunianum TaxID=1367462 RepID=UPI00202F21D9|nr:hypothetical protein [Clostridium swellfunianum]MCM0650177.1 hypothetical protein [Clostridium swellfunianum]
MMKKVLCLIVLAILSITVLLTGCTKKNTNNLIITNKSSEIINSLAIQRGNQTDVMGSKLESNQKCYFDMGVQDNYTFVVEFEDANKQIIRSKQITASFNHNRNGAKNINISKDNDKEWSITLEN